MRHRADAASTSRAASQDAAKTSARSSAGTPSRINGANRLGASARCGERCAPSATAAPSMAKAGAVSAASSQNQSIEAWASQGANTASAPAAAAERAVSAFGRRPRRRGRTRTHRRARSRPPARFWESPRAGANGETAAPPRSSRAGSTLLEVRHSDASPRVSRGRGPMRRPRSRSDWSPRWQSAIRRRRRLGVGLEVRPDGLQAVARASSRGDGENQGGRAQQGRHRGDRRPARMRRDNDRGGRCARRSKRGPVRPGQCRCGQQRGPHSLVISWGSCSPAEPS